MLEHSELLQDIISTDSANQWMFETVDYHGIPVVLSRLTWLTKAGGNQKGSHPEIQDYMEDIKHTIESPDIVFQSHRDDRSCVFYKLNVGRGDFEGKNLVVIVKYVDDPDVLRGYVSTMYISRTIYSKGTEIWNKTKK